MLETLLAKTQTSIIEGSRGLRWLRIFPPGVWIIITVLTLVGGRLFWQNARYPAHRQEITAAFGSTRLFYGLPQVNHDGSRFIYVATTDHGYALFLCGTATGHKQVITQQDGTGIFGDSFYISAKAWSPDDTSFIYTIDDKLIICSADSLKPSAQLPIETNAVSELVWLDPGAFVYLTHGTNLYYAQKQPDGQWNQHNASNTETMSSLTAIDVNTIAWLQDNLICRMNVAELTGTNNPFTTTPLTPAAVTDNLPQTNGLVLWLDASRLKQDNGTPVDRLADLSPNKNDAVANGISPTYNAADGANSLNRKGTIHFSADSEHSTTNAAGLTTKAHLGIIGSTPRSVFAVIRRALGRQMMISIGDTAKGGGYFGLLDSSAAFYIPHGWGKADIIIPKQFAGKWNMLEAIYDGFTESGWINGTIGGTMIVPLNTADKEVQIGSRMANPAGKYAAGSDGDFAELLIYNRALSSEEREQIEHYLHQKWFGAEPFSAKNPLVWFNLEIGLLTGLSYSKETGCLLISRTENGWDSLWSLDTKSGDSTTATQILQGRFLHGAQWTGAGEFAYASRDPRHAGLILTDSSGTENERLFEHGNIKRFKVSPDQKQIVFFGTISNEPSDGIWQYAIGSGQLQSVVPYSDYSSVFARIPAMSEGEFKLPSGRTLNCVVFPPANFDRHKKYPLVIGDTFIPFSVNGPNGRQWLQNMSACGAYVVIVTRPGWWPKIDQWEENIMDVYKTLAYDPCVDTSRIYLFAASAETRYLSELVSKSPDPWRGVIYLNPVSLPDLSQSPLFQLQPRILMSYGDKEHPVAEFKEFQADALKYGVMTDIIVSPGEGHRFVGNAAQMERTKAIMHLIFEE